MNSDVQSYTPADIRYTTSKDGSLLYATMLGAPTVANGASPVLHFHLIGGGPGRSPTCDLRVRSALLYATELPGH